MARQMPAAPNTPAGPVGPAPSTNGNGKTGKGPDFEPGTPEHKAQIVNLAFMGTMGMTREQAEALYDSQLREWYAQQGKEPPG